MERYSWKQMPSEYNASYFNEKDFKEGRKFVVIDNVLGKEYIFPIITICKNKYDTFYEKMEFPSELQNEEFLGWVISNSRDFINYLDKSLLTPSVIGYVVDNFKFPEIFELSYNNRLKYIMSKGLWERAFKTNPEVVRYVPSKYMTLEMYRVLENIKNPIINSDVMENISIEAFRKMYYNCDKEHRLNLIPPMTGRFASPSYKTALANLITQDIADDILSININTIWLIPKKFISEDNAIKAMNWNIVYIRFVSKEYQSFEYQKKAIDAKAKNISLIDEDGLEEDLIYYAIKKDPSSLGSVPKKRRTEQICMYAANFKGVLKFVPDNLKTYELCYFAVKNDPRAVKYVPARVLTKDFVKRLQQEGINFTIDGYDYIKTCLESHDRLEREKSEIEQYVTDTSKESSISQYSNIRLDSLNGLFSLMALNVLSSYNISTVGDLLNVKDNSDFYSALLDVKKAAYVEIRGVIRLLKCKYMDVDPLIDFSKDDVNDMQDLCKKLGFSTRVTNCLCRLGYTPKKFYDLLHDEHIEEVLLSLRSFGVNSIQEIISKGTIVVEYYDEKQPNKEESIDELREKLARLKNESKLLNEQISLVLEQIEEAMAKGNGLK